MPVPGGFVAVGDCIAMLDDEGVVVQAARLDVPMVSLAAHDGWLYAVDTLGKEILMIHESGVIVARIEPPLKGYLQAVASDGKMLWAVTDAGEILSSQNGFVWKTIDFNTKYAGFYPEMDFRAVAAGGSGVMFSLPSCSHCNNLERYADDVLYSRVSTEDKVLLLGSDGCKLLEKP